VVQAVDTGLTQGPENTQVMPIQNFKALTASP